MHTAPTLAATGTIAVAAVGLSFARPHPTWTRNIPHDNRHAHTSTSPEAMSRLTEQSSPSSTHPLLDTSSFDEEGASNCFAVRKTPKDTLSVSPANGDDRTPPPRRNLPPNKLVKRSASISPSIEIGPPGRKPSLKRPATSHQRAASHLLSTPAKRRPSTADKLSQSSFTDRNSHFFTSRVPRKGFNVDPHVRRLYPDGDAPTLMLGHVVTASTLEADDSLDPLTFNDAASVRSSRPSTPRIFSFSSAVPAPSQPKHAADERRRPSRRSFSIGDMLEAGATTWRSASLRSKTPSVLRRKPRRSIPLKDSAQEGLRTSPYQEGAQPHCEKRESSTPDTDSMSTGPIRGPSPDLSSSFTRPQTAMSRPSRPSTTPSEIASSQLGSDNGTRVFSSGDEDDGDFRSDTVYDSMRTGVTRSSSGFRGPGLETLFDKPPEIDEHSEHEQSLMFGNSPRTAITQGWQSSVEEDGSVSTPVRTVVGASREESRSHGTPRAPLIDNPSPPQSVSQALNLGTLAWGISPEQEETTWSADDEDWDAVPDSPTPLGAHKRLMWANSDEEFTSATSGPRSSQKAGRSPWEYETKSSLFDWSEQQPLHKTSGSTSPPRPKTVHGKKDTDARGSRSTGRRAPSALHARSQSVPVVPDVVGERMNMTHKFGTWGIGSKGVTEDWNDDFDFEEPRNERSPDGRSEDEAKVESASVMHIPRGIRAAQTNVLANIDLLKEWGLLIEELKELRGRVVSLGISIERERGIFSEVDAMIELADQEAQDDGFAEQKSMTSSPGFSADDFEDSPRTRALSSMAETSGDRDILESSPLSGLSRQQQQTAQITPTRSTRPRKNSEAVALHVIEELHKRRAASDPDINRGPKMEFDTATLKHIVPYVNQLMRRVKVILRDAEGLSISPRQQRRGEEPALSQAFVMPREQSPSAGRSRRMTRGLDERNLAEVVADIRRLTMT